MKKQIPENVVFTASGTRGIVGEGLTPDFVLSLGQTYGTWLRRKKPDGIPRVLVGRDTRPSGLMLENGMVHALLSTGCIVHVAGVCPTPGLVHAKQHHGFDGAVIISASHNPAEYNGFKFLSPKKPGTFMGPDELMEFKEIFSDTKNYRVKSWTEPDLLRPVDVIPEYLDSILSYIGRFYRGEAGFKVVVDDGAGTGKLSAVPILEALGCSVQMVNDKMLDDPPFFPRDSEPIAENLSLLSKSVLDEGADFGIGLDCDADRISFCDEKGNILREDIGLALIMKNLLELADEHHKLVIVTNIASSLMFDDIARQWNGEIIRTPIGERFLAVKMEEIRTSSNFKEEPLAIIGGEGSCGGVMIPEINLARDAAVATACIVAIMKKRDLLLSELVKELKQYHLEKVKLKTAGKDPKKIMEKLASNHDASSFKRIMNDVYFNGDGWWVLIHPSNTEPVIRILVESTNEDKAKALLKKHEEELMFLLND
ncbi:MAG: hypothetical protein ACTSVI_13410 [Promethearchaeota archaeon]